MLTQTACIFWATAKIILKKHPSRVSSHSLNKFVRIKVTLVTNRGFPREINTKMLPLITHFSWAHTERAHVLYMPVHVPWMCTCAPHYMQVKIRALFIPIKMNYSSLKMQVSRREDKARLYEQRGHANNYTCSLSVMAPVIWIPSFFWMTMGHFSMAMNFPMGRTSIESAIKVNCSI